MARVAFRVYLQTSSFEQLIKSPDMRLYSWHISVESRREDDEAWPDHKGTDILLCETPLASLPSAEQMLPKAVEALKGKLQEIYIHAELECKEVNERLAKLLALPAPEPRPEPQGRRGSSDITDIQF